MRSCVRQADRRDRRAHAGGGEEILALDCGP